jgi:hypothetical protein
MQAPQLPRSELFTSLEEPTCDLGGGMASGRECCQKKASVGFGRSYYVHLPPTSEHLRSLETHFN